jgi:predicted RNA-binding protein with PIN domain
VTSLPEVVRHRVVSLAADVLGGLRADEVPVALRAVARFAAAKRARLGGTAIAAALEAEPGFRRHVLEAARAAHPGLVEALAAGPAPPAADPVDVAMIAYLLRPEGWTELVTAAGASARRAEDEAQAARDAAVAARLREQLSAARAEARETRERSKAETERLKSENAALRRRLGEAREQAAAAQEAERTGASEAARVVEAASSYRAATEAETRRLRSRLAGLEEALENARRADREGRSLDTARLGLLLDTLVEAAAGLRRELALPVSALRPADTVDALEPGEPAGRSGSQDDPAFLEELLALPRAHLVVDGYNVTKSAWPTMPLEAQRTRLVQGLAGLAARTSAEITCVFDGADVSVPPAVTAGQGVRVRFSRQGQTADDLILRLVGAEPPGRPVTVVSSDREVADGARQQGARALDAVALVQLLG